MDAVRAVGAAPDATLRSHLVLRGRSIPVVLPTLSDPRLKLGLVITTLQVLGQTALEFKVSVAQILVSLVTCAVIEVSVTYRREGIVVWPASALLTGNSVAFILRTTGTQHGDWWSLNGIHFFVLACVLSLSSKYLIRPGGRHVFNPSNVGLVWVLLLVGPTKVFPQYLWWGPIGPPVIAALIVILIGAVWILRTVRMVPMALSFFVPFAMLIGAFAAAGRSFFAIWHDGPVAGAEYWFNIVMSPEVLVFVFFMMSDPVTAPKDRVGRMIYGAATAFLAALLIYFQPTEFGIKVAILASLTATCGLVPLIERARARSATAGASLRTSRALRTGLRRLKDPVVAVTVIIAIAAPIDAAALADDRQIILIERRLTGVVDPQ